MSLQVELAIQVAKEFHAGQEYNPGVTYFDGHLHRVAQRVIDMQYDDDTVAAAYLHDSLEDTPLLPGDLASRGVSESVIAAVEAVTKRKGEAADVYLGRVALVPRAIVVKFADSTENLLATISSGPDNPKYVQWMHKYSTNLAYLAVRLPDPASLQN